MRHYLNLTVVALILLMNACSKSDQMNSVDPDQGLIDSARIWLNASVPEIAGSGVKLGWEKTDRMDAANGIRILEVPMQTSRVTNGVINKDQAAEKSGKSYTYSSLIIYHSARRGFYYAILKVIGDSTYVKEVKTPVNSFRKLDKRLSGLVILQRWDGSMIKGHTYKNGKRINKISRRVKGHAPKETGMERYDCIHFTVDYYQQVCVGASCGEWTYLYSDTYYSCTYVSDSPDPSDPDEEIDWIDPGDGGGGGGGDTDHELPPTDDFREIRIDTSIMNNFPCATKILADLRNNVSYEEVVAPFAAPLRPDLTWKAGQLVWGGGANYAMGETETLGSSATVIMNANALKNASELLIAATMIHETLHANANYYVNWKSAGEDPMPSWATAAFEGLMLEDNSLPGNPRDHAAMMEAIFYQMTMILRDWGGQKYTDKEYKMAMLYGMDNSNQMLANGTIVVADPQTMTKVNTLFQKLKQDNNITSADLNTFNTQNVTATPANKKLPTSGC